LKDEFVKAIGDTPNNFRLTEIDVSAMSSVLWLMMFLEYDDEKERKKKIGKLINDEKTIKRILDYYVKLNAGGRRILANYANSSNVNTINNNDTAARPAALAPTITSDSTDDNGRTSGNIRDNDVAAHAPSDTGVVPLGLWPLVIERANRLYPLLPFSPVKDECNISTSVTGNSVGRSAENNNSNVDATSTTTANTTNSEGVDFDDCFHSGDVIYCLLHGPMVFENYLGHRPSVER